LHTGVVYLEGSANIFSLAIIANDSGFAIQITTGVMKKEILVEFESENF